MSLPPHNIIPKQRSPAPDDSPTPNIAEYIKSIPSWSPDEQLILEENMKHYPISQNAEFKRLTLLMTNLPNKRLRDVSLRVKYMKAKETQEISWENFLQNSFGQQKVELSPSHSVKSPRQTPIEREEKPKRKQTRIKKDENKNENETDQLSINSMNQKYSMNQHNTPMNNQNVIDNNFNYRMNNANIHQTQNMGSMNTSMYSNNRNTMMYSNPSMRSNLYVRDRPFMSVEEQTCDQLINENEHCIDVISNALFHKSNDISDSVNNFHQNITRIIQITQNMSPQQLPYFYTQPTNISIPKFKKVDLPPEHLRQGTYPDYQLGKSNLREDPNRRNDMM